MRLDVTGQRIETWNSGRGFMLLGGLLSLAGVLFVYMLVSGGNHGIMAGDRPAGPVDAWLPALLALVGLALAGYHGRAEIDIGARARTQHRRWWWRMSSKREPLGEPTRVTLRAERRGSGKNSRTVYAVRLVTSAGEYEVASPGNERAGRNQAESVARLCSVPLHDLRGGTELVRDADELDRSVLDTDDGHATGPVAVPTSCRVRIEHDGARTSFRVPAPAAWLLLLGIVPVSVPLVFFGAFWFPGLMRNHGGGWSPAGWFLWLGLPLALCLVPAVVVIVAAFGGGLLPRRVVAERGVLRVGRARFPASELEELHVSTGAFPFSSYLRAASDRTIRRLGRGLSAAELEYLRWAILEALRNSR